jgi:hypothetical protein
MVSSGHRHGCRSPALVIGREVVGDDKAKQLNFLNFNVAVVALGLHTEMRGNTLLHAARSFVGACSMCGQLNET